MLEIKQADSMFAKGIQIRLLHKEEDAYKEASILWLRKDITRTMLTLFSVL